MPRSFLTGTTRKAARKVIHRAMRRPMPVSATLDGRESKIVGTLPPGVRILRKTAAAGTIVSAASAASFHAMDTRQVTSCLLLLQL